MAQPTVLLADDHALFRDGIASLLRAGGLQVVGHAGNGAEAVSLARELRPDLILMDVNMPEVSGLDATRAIKTEMPDVKVVMLTVSDDDGDLFESIRSGADGYILKNTPGDDFADLISRVFDGEPAMSRGLASRILGEMRGDDRTVSAETSDADGLTERETEVLSLAGRGSTNREIGEALTISESTVNYHMRHVLAKLHMRNRTEAAAYAIRQGLIQST